MDEYIKRQDALDAVTQAALWGSQYGIPYEEIKNMPDEDVVSVVRCKDCEMRKEYFNSGQFVCTQTQCTVCGHAWFVNDYDFCSRGKMINNRDKMDGGGVHKTD